MSWAANLTVTKVTHRSDGTTEVTAEATLDEAFKVQYAHHDDTDSVDAVGLQIVGEENIQSINVKFTMSGETHIEKGFVLNANGHFDKVNTVKRYEPE